MSMAPFGCVHGRFQIFHLDHLLYFKLALEYAERLLIGITSFDIRHLHNDQGSHRTLAMNNPLTYFERTDMIRRTLVDDASIPEWRFSFTPFPIEQPELLPDFVPTSVPCFTTVRERWNRDKLVILLRLGYSVVVLKDDPDKKISGSAIREMMILGDSTWTHSVAPATESFLEEHRIVKRLCNLHGMTKGEAEA